jgi:hypothetical protein
MYADQIITGSQALRRGEFTIVIACAGLLLA